MLPPKKHTKKTTTTNKQTNKASHNNTNTPDNSNSSHSHTALLWGLCSSGPLSLLHNRISQDKPALLSCWWHTIQTDTGDNTYHSLSHSPQVYACLITSLLHTGQLGAPALPSHRWHTTRTHTINNTHHSLSQSPHTPLTLTASLLIWSLTFCKTKSVRTACTSKSQMAYSTNCRRHKLLTLTQPCSLCWFGLWVTTDVQLIYSIRSAMCACREKTWLEAGGGGGHDSFTACIA